MEAYKLRSYCLEVRTENNKLHFSATANLRPKTESSRKTEFFFIEKKLENSDL